jgi:NitT/TauT family transport system substrate-binding protein
VEKKYINSSPELNALALSHLRYMPSVSGAKDAVISAAEAMKKSQMLEARTDPAELAKLAFMPLPGVSDEWIRDLDVEKVADGGPPIEAEVAAAIKAFGTQGVKTCCVVKK